MNRRRFLKTAAGAVVGLGTAGRFLSARTGVAPGDASARRKLIVAVFGGGTRYSESVGDPEHRHIPRLWKEMVPKGTLFANVQVEGRIVHTNCTASLLTGCREYDEDNDWSRPPAHPTIFEVFRNSRAAPDTAAWAFVYASILAEVGESRAAGYGADHAANVVEPPTITRDTAERLEARMRHGASQGSTEAELKEAQEAARLVKMESRIARVGLRSDAARAFLDREYDTWKAGDGTTSHDAFLTDRAIACMKEFAPDVLMVAFGEIDCAHYGQWSRYVEAIQRTDELTWRLWRAAEELDAYRGQTLMLVIPDHGRELERPGGMGFIHHSDFYTGENVDAGCRRIWMLALGPNVPAGKTVPDPTPALNVAATGLEHLGLQAPSGAASSAWALIR
jgi:hypothetical protein